MLFYEANESLLELSVCFHFFVFFNAPPIALVVIENVYFKLRFFLFESAPNISEQTSFYLTKTELK